MSVTFVANLKTTNPSNNSQGISRRGMYARAATRKKQRELIRLLTLAHVKRIEWPLVVTITRVAPSNGLDEWDGLPAALKSCVDGIADGLGLSNDRDDRVTWKVSQRRGKNYAVEVNIQSREATHE